MSWIGEFAGKAAAPDENQARLWNWKPKSKSASNEGVYTLWLLSLLEI